MDRYSFLRALADSWVLLLLFLFFIGVALFVWRPGSRKLQKDAATSIFRNEEHPAPPEEGPADPLDTARRSGFANPDEPAVQKEAPHGR